MLDLNMFANGVTGDFYLGKGAGRMIEESIQSAKRRIWILSPYVSPETVNILIDKYDRDVNIKLVTSETQVERIRNGKSKVSNFIVENGTADHKKLTKYISLVVSSAIAVSFSLWLIISNFIVNRIPVLSISNAIAIALAIGSYFLIQLAFKTRFMNYSYATKVPIYFLKDPYAGKAAGDRSGVPFIHSKVYLVDDEVYFGSINLTKEGFDSNIESRFKTANSSLVQNVVDMFLKIQNEESSLVDIPTLGYRVFHQTKDFKKRKF